MSIGSRLRWFLVFSALGLGVPSAYGCKDKETKEDSKADKDDEKGDKGKKGKGKAKKGGDDDSDDDKGKKAKKGDDDDKGSADKGETVAYEKGNVLKYAPKGCDAGFAFFGVSTLMKSEVVTGNAELLQEKLSSAMKGDDGKKAAAAMKALKKGGIDVTKDIKEFAFCAPKDFGDPIVLIGGNFSGKDALGLVSKMGEAGGDDPLEKKTADGVSYLKLKKKGIMALVGPNVIAVGDHQDDVLALAKAPNGGSTWGVDADEIFVFKMVDKKEQNIDATITEKGENLDFKVTMVFPDESKAAEGFKKNPAAAKAELKKAIDQVAGKLEKSPLKKLADDVKGIKIDVDGAKVTFTVSIPTAHVGEIVKSAATADPADLKKAFK